MEEAFLEGLEVAPEELEPFVAAARGLVGSGEEDRAAVLLELLDEKLTAVDADEHRLQLLREAGAIRFDAAGDEHALMLEIVRRLYAGSASVEGLIETVGLHRAIEDRKKNWDKLDRLRSLLRYDVGAIVMMEGRGVGEVIEVNTALKKFNVDFHGHGGLKVGFAAAAKLLTPLAPDHVLRRKLEDPGSLSALVKSDPPELLREVLESYSEPLTGGEIRQVLSGIVPPSGWASWWNAARKHPQVVMHSGGRPAYSWAESADHVLSGLAARFSAANLDGKIEIYKQAAQRDAELKRRMGSELAAKANLLWRDDPVTALSLRYVLDRTSGPIDKLDWSPADLTPDAASAVDLLQRISDRQEREALVESIGESAADPTAIYAEYLPKEEIPRILDLLTDRLEADDPERLERALSAVLSQPQTSPAAFVWLSERAADDEEIRRRFSLRLLQQVTRALSLDAMRPYRVRLLKLFESGGTMPRLLPLLDREAAARAEDAIDKCGALETTTASR